MEKKRLVLNTHAELERLLETEWYESRVYRKFNTQETKKLEDRLESLNSGYLPEEGYTLFDDMEEELGRLPTQEEFLTRHVNMIKEFTFDQAERFRNGHTDRNGVYYQGDVPEGYHLFSLTQNVQLPWSDVIENYFRYRANNLYGSMLAELSALLHIRNLYPDAIIYTGGILDTSFTVDITVKFPDKNLTLYFHITSYSNKYYWNNEEAGPRANVRNKVYRNSRGYPKGLHKDSFGNITSMDGVRYRQEHPSHIILAYQKKGSSYDERNSRLKRGTMEVNGNRMFTEEYLEELIDASLRGENLDGTVEWNLRLSRITNTPEQNLQHMLQHENLEDNELRYFIEWAIKEGKDLSGIKVYSNKPNKVYHNDLLPTNN